MITITMYGRQYLQLLVELLLLLGYCSCKQQYALNVPRVLLPVVAAGVRSNFTIIATHGCFIWISTKPEVASVEVVEPNEKRSCSRKAVVTAQSTQVMRLSSVIVAEEVGGGIVLRCDVFVDTISRIEITTRTRELLLEEEPERFELQAFDDEGNTFSTLNGHVVDWVLLADQEAAHQQEEPGAILNFIPFEESTYSTDPVIRRLEAKGLQGETVLVAGVSTGSAKVQASLIQKVWKKVKPSMVKLLVIENLMLIPSMDVYILRFSYVDYHIHRRKHGRTEVVPLPSNQYSLHLTNTTVGGLDSLLSRVVGLKVGFTEVVLENQNMVHMPTATKPTAGIHVVAPHHLGFTIAPDNVWVLETGREYIISIHIFDKNNHKIHPSETTPLHSTLPLEHLTVHFSSSNGTYHHVTARKAGHAFIYSELPALLDHIKNVLHKLSDPISRRQVLYVYDPITVVPTRLVLLWDGSEDTRCRYTLKATGGSGTYVWSCDPEGVISVTGNGTLETLEKGVAIVHAADVRNTVHFNQSEIHVIPPARMNFLSSPVEAMIGHTLSLPLQVVGYVLGDDSDPLPFPDCRQLNLDITFSDPAIFNLSLEEVEGEELQVGACRVIMVTAVAPGNTGLIVSYTGGKNNTITMRAMVTIAAYSSMVSVDPETIAVVTLGASKLFVFEGGPSPWILDISTFYKNMSAEMPDKVDLQPWSPSRVGVAQHVYLVTCLELGEQTLTILVGNDPSHRNPFPLQDESSAIISCALPVSMVMHPILSQMPDCPLYGRDSSHTLQFPVLCSALLVLEFKFFDAESRPFDNFTSLSLHWESSDKDLLSLPSTSDLHHYGNKATLKVNTGIQPGTVTVTVTCNAHIQTFYTNDPRIERVDPFTPGVKLTASFLLRQTPVVSPSSLLLYNHPDNRATLVIQYGSGHFHVESTAQDIPHLPAKVAYSPKNREIILVPSHEGRMRLDVRDVCLEVGPVRGVNVVVGGVHRIDVVIVDKVQVGNSIPACVRVYNKEGVVFPKQQLKYMKLQPHSKTFHITVYPSTSSFDEDTSNDTDAICYTVDGMAIGPAYLAFNATTLDGSIISSPPKEIQVFEPLKLHPNITTLLPTATFQIQSSGGPKPQMAVFYSISNETVATMSDSGLITATEVGVAVITGRVQLTDPSGLGHVITYSEYTVTVMVVLMTGVKIYLPTTRLLSGVSVAVYAVGFNNESPFTFASVVPEMAFHWSVSNMDAFSVTSVYDKAGISLQEEQDFDAALHTRNPGQGALRLAVKCPPGVCLPDLASFLDQVRVEVLSPLRLLLPLDGHFLLPHGGRTQIVTNRDGVLFLNYQVLNSCREGVAGGGNGIVTVSQQGVVEAATVNGHAVVMVTESEETFGLNQTLIVHVEVHSVASLSISPISLVQATPNSKNHAFPLGYTAEFIAHLHDNAGRRFDYAEISLAHQLNHFDIALVAPESGNTTYVVKATKQGNVILRVWVTAFPHIADYVRIRVAYAILPSLGVVHLGSVVCFSTHLTEEDQRGSWEVGEGGVMVVDANSGVGRSMAVGRVVVYHKIQNIIDTHTEITVAKVSEVLFDEDEEDDVPVFTNGNRLEGLGDYLIPVRFVQSNGEELSPLHTSIDKQCLTQAANVVGVWPGAWLQQVPFECYLEMKEHEGTVVMMNRYIVVEPTFDLSTGTSACRLFSAGMEQAESLAGKEGVELSLKVVAFDSFRTYSVTSAILSVPFIPAFYISRREVVLRPTDRETDLTIKGLPKQLQTLKVTSPYPLSVVQTSTLGTTANYRLSLLPSYHSPPEEPFTNLTVSFLCPYTQQEEHVSVTLAEGGACEVTPKSPPMKFKDEKNTPSYPAAQSDSTNYFPAVIAAIFFLVLILLVVCLALQKSTSDPRSGFVQHLPPVTMATPHSTPSHSYSPVSSPPVGSPQQPSINIPPGSTMRYPHSSSQTPQTTPFSGGIPTSMQRQTRSSMSPKQHGLFSQ